MRPETPQQLPNGESSPTDHSLVRLLQGGTSDAATQLYLRYAARLQSLAAAQTSPQLSSRFDPEDVVQSVFRTFFRRAQQGLYDVPPGGELWQLLLVLALNKIRELATHHRAQKRDVARTLGSTALEGMATAGPGGDETPLQVLRMVVESILGEYGDVQRRIVELRIEGHRVEDIARLTDRSKRTVERTLQGFRDRLSQMIDVDTK